MMDAFVKKCRISLSKSNAQAANGKFSIHIKNPHLLTVARQLFLSNSASM